ncbi:MAG TPA: hypothetical protein VM031_05510 [Phycisphaerae bacterium]|nr:hypothetical protein [Phycisphaerae bacterium]
MGPPPGTRNDREGGLGRLLAGAGRWVGFCLLTGAAMTVFAAVLLLPDYARMLRAKHELARQEAVIADLAALIEANRRLIDALPESPVLTKRLAMRQLGLRPADELVVLTAEAPHTPPPGAVLVPHHPRPQPPNPWMLTIAGRVAHPPTRRGLLLLAAAAVIAAVLMFPGRESRKAAAAAG